MKGVSTELVAVGIFVVALLLAGVVSFYAASTPDGLTKVSEDQGFADTEKEHGAGDGPFAGYGSSFIDNERLSGGVAGVVGVLVVLVAGTGLTLALRRRAPQDDEPGRVDDVGLMGAPHGHQLHFHGHSPVHRAPAHLKVARAAGVHARGGRDAARLVPAVRRATCWYCSRWSRSAGCRRRTCSSGWSSRCRSCSSRCCCPSSRPARAPSSSGSTVSEPGLHGRRGAAGQGDARGDRRASRWPPPPSRRRSLQGLARLRMPALLVQIMGFMVRYLEVVTDEMHADAGGARVARASGRAIRGTGRCWRDRSGRCSSAVLRARRAGPPGDALARLHGQAAR